MFLSQIPRWLRLWRISGHNLLSCNHLQRLALSLCNATSPEIIWPGWKSQFCSKLLYDFRVWALFRAPCQLWKLTLLQVFRARALVHPPTPFHLPAPEGLSITWPSFGGCWQGHGRLHILSYIYCILLYCILDRGDLNGRQKNNMVNW